LLGGIDVDILCRSTPADIVEMVYARARKYRSLAQGYALGSGNSIPEYVPVEGYLAMLEAAQKIRAEEA
jgi:uroporphyrinogen decarboxylase